METHNITNCYNCNEQLLHSNYNPRICEGCPRYHQKTVYGNHAITHHQRKFWIWQGITKVKQFISTHFGTPTACLRSTAIVLGLLYVVCKLAG